MFFSKNGKNLNMSIVTIMVYCIEVVGKEGQGAEAQIQKISYLKFIFLFQETSREGKQEEQNLTLVLDTS